MKKILIIGCGGIGSFLCGSLSRLILLNQINLADLEIAVADNDTVEWKNIQYQDFTSDDVMQSKASVIAKRYGFLPIVQRITESEQLKGYDLIILAVDNASTRKQVYDFCYCNSVEFFDLRAEGRTIAGFTMSGNTKEEMLRSLGGSVNEPNNQGRSCQLESDLRSNIIQNGNVIIAVIGSQMVDRKSVV